MASYNTERRLFQYSQIDTVPPCCMPVQPRPDLRGYTDVGLLELCQRTNELMAEHQRYQHELQQEIIRRWKELAAEVAEGW